MTDEVIREALLPWQSPPAGVAQEETDRFYMKAALHLAELSADEGEVPVGCVIVREGRIVAASGNARESERDATAHAECRAISNACRALGGWRLTGCTLYVTLEPCPMCAGAVWCSRVNRVVYGAKDAAAGAMGSLLNLSSYPLNYRPAVTSGILATESRDLLRRFFTARREQNSYAEDPSVSGET